MVAASDLYQVKDSTEWTTLLPETKTVKKVLLWAGLKLSREAGEGVSNTICSIEHILSSRISLEKSGQHY